MLFFLSSSQIAWALKKGFLTKKAGRPDTYRAGRHVCVGVSALV